MKQRETPKKNPLPGIIIFAVFAFFSMMEEIPDEIVGIVIVVLALAVIGAAAFFVGKAIVKSGRQERHTHDRIDHSSDLKINPRTGRTESLPVTAVHQHSPREHWKRQLDDLLANGTIDRDEYRAMLNRKF